MENFEKSEAESSPKLSLNQRRNIQNNGKLPSELVEIMLGFLSCQELMACYDTCTSWRKLVFDILLKKSKLVSTYFEIQITDWIDNILYSILFQNINLFG